jgi:hypothetical protein
MTLVSDMITKSRGIEELLKLVDGYPPSAGLLMVHLLTSAVDHTKLSRSRRDAVDKVIIALRCVKDSDGRSGDPRVLIPVLPMLPVDEVLDIFTQLWLYPPAVMLAAVERIRSVKKFPCPVPLHQLLQHILSKVPTQARAMSRFYPLKVGFSQWGGLVLICCTGVGRDHESSHASADSGHTDLSY